jgi:hypothetical protein
MVDRTPLYGTGRFERDDMLGSILRISLEDAGPGSPAIVIKEDDWDALITPDFRQGADYCLILGAKWEAEKERAS